MTNSRVVTTKTSSFEASGYIYTMIRLKDASIRVFGTVYSVPIHHYMDYICLN